MIYDIERHTWFHQTTVSEIIIISQVSFRYLCRDYYHVSYLSRLLLVDNPNSQ